MFENCSDFHSSRCWLVVVGIALLLLCCHNMYLHGVIDVVLLLVVLFCCYHCWRRLLMWLVLLLCGCCWCVGDCSYCFAVVLLVSAVFLEEK